MIIIDVVYKNEPYVRYLSNVVPNYTVSRT
jgi:hypothetical protein